MIQEPHATLQDAVTWRNQCRDRATLQGVTSVLETIRKPPLIKAQTALKTEK